MKRYRVFNVDLDSRAATLSFEIQSTWDERVKELHKKNQIQTIVHLGGEFGVYGGDKKIQDFIALNNAPFSIIAFHNDFLRQVRNAFVIGAYFPALTGACSLGERILNHLVLSLRDFYKDTSEHRKIAKKASFNDWDLAIDTLNSWSVLLPNVVEKYRELRMIRHQKAVHFNPATDTDAREYALDAIHLLQDIIQEQFGGLGPQPWFIPNIRGTSFIKREFETTPFIRAVYLPNCRQVGPYHKVDIQFDGTNYRYIVTDDYQYDDKEISDDEFAELYNNRSR